MVHDRSLIHTAAPWGLATNERHTAIPPIFMLVRDETRGGFRVISWSPPKFHLIGNIVGAMRAIPIARNFKTGEVRSG